MRFFFMCVAKARVMPRKEEMQSCAIHRATLLKVNRSYQSDRLIADQLQIHLPGPDVSLQYESLGQRLEGI